MDDLFIVTYTWHGCVVADPTAHRSLEGARKAIDEFLDEHHDSITDEYEHDEDGKVWYELYARKNAFHITKTPVQD